MNLRGQEGEALTFGKAMHKGLEHWYTLPVGRRSFPKDLVKEAELMSFGNNLDTVVDGPLESVRQFCLAAKEIINVSDTDKRSVSNGVKILIAYSNHYANDMLEIHKDDKGLFIERDFSFEIAEDEENIYEYFGRIDVALRNVEFDTVFIADHKTTAALGKEFYNRIKPNHQYTGYILAGLRCFNISSNTFMVNGIQVAKTKSEFARQFTDRNDEDFEELKQAVVTRARDWIRAKDRNTFPMNAPNPCSSYGGCQYIEVCSVPNKLKPTVIQSKYSKE